MINNKYEDLISEFKSITKQRWLKSVNNSTNGVGLTFEKLISKEPDSMFFPDYYGTEIKCTTRFSGYPITLFTIAFDGETFYEMNRLLEKYGKQDTIYKDKKILISNLAVNKKILVNNKYYFEIKLDYCNKKLFLAIYDINKNLIEKSSYIDFSSLKTHLELKLSRLTLVYASKKRIENDNYYRYYKMIIYELKSFETFLELLNNNIIKVEIVGRVSRSGSEKGRQRNKNLVFKLPKENITYLFNEILILDLDKK